MNFCLEPLASNASISGRNLSNLLFPIQRGRPNLIPICLSAASASLVRWLIRSLAISAAIENAIATILDWIDPFSCQLPLMA